MCTQSIKPTVKHQSIGLRGGTFEPPAWTRLGLATVQLWQLLNLTNLVLDPIEEILPEHAAHHTEQTQAKPEYADDEAAIAALAPGGVVLRGHGGRRRMELVGLLSR